MTLFSGVWTRTNNDVLCDSDLRCAQLSWNGQRPDLKTDKPVVRDTIVVPPRGYAVVRFRYVNDVFTSRF